MCVDHVCGLCLWRPGKSFGSPETGVIHGFEPVCGCWVPNQDLLQELSCFSLFFKLAYKVLDIIMAVLKKVCFYRVSSPLAPLRLCSYFKPKHVYVLNSVSPADGPCLHRGISLHQANICLVLQNTLDTVRQSWAKTLNSWTIQLRSTLPGLER